MRAWQLSCAPPSRAEVWDAAVPGLSLSARQSPPLVRVSDSLDCLAMCSSSLSLPLSAFLSLSACLFLSPSLSLCLPIAPFLSVSLCLSPSSKAERQQLAPSRPQRASGDLVHCFHPRHTLTFPLLGDPHVVQMTTLALEFTVSSRITGCNEHIRAERVG